KRQVFTRGRRVQVGVFPAALAAERLRAEVAEIRSSRRQGIRTILRVDRLDPAKNITRGFLAFEELLLSRPHHRGKVRFTALLSPSRTELPEYRRYARAVRSEVSRINGAFATASWQPIDLQIKDDHAAALRAFLDYDVLLVNPVADGMNLVSMEGP